MVIQVIGATSGVGKAIAENLLHNGHSVGVGLFTYTEETAAAWEQYKERAVLSHTDVTDEASLAQSAEELHRRFGGIDVVVNVAGILLPSDRTNDIVHTDYTQFRAMMEVNAYGVLSAFRCTYPYMKKNGRSCYAAVTAMGGTFLMEGTMFPAYVISKVTANKIVQTIKNTVSDVRVLAIHPGKVNTDMGRTTAEIEPEESAQGICRLLTQEEAPPSWFLNYTGEALPI